MRLCAASGALPAILSAQQTPAETPEEPEEPEQPLTTIQIDVQLVNIFCSARTKRGQLVTDLTKEEFEVYEDKKEQKISYFSRETDLPITMGMLVDVSRSQENLLGIEKRAAAAFFNSVLRKKDLAFVLSFGSEVELMQDYTSSPEYLRQSLDRLEIRGGGPSTGLPGPVPTMGQQRGTVLYDAVWLAAREKLSSEVGRKALILITDGIDMGSRVSRDDAIEAAQKADAIIYSIYYFDSRIYAGTGYWPHSGDLKKLSEETGGRLFEADRKQSLEEIFRQIQEELRSQYAIGYSSSNPEQKGEFRRVEIKTTRPGVKIQARKGYYA